MTRPKRIASPFSSYAPDYAEVKVLENVKSFAMELEFTDTYRKNINVHVAIREARCLRVLFPRILQEIRPGDVVTSTRQRNLVWQEEFDGGLDTQRKLRFNI